MLPTPTTTHLSFDRIYEPSEDSYLLLDTLSSPSETSFLSTHFPSTSPTPLILEIGTGSGIVLTFLHTNTSIIFSRPDILTLGIDINPFACQATLSTILISEKEKASEKKEGKGKGDHGFYMGNIMGNLTSCLKSRSIDVLIFNPPYVPTESLPLPLNADSDRKTTYEEDSNLLALSYAGGKGGMEITDRLLDDIREGEILSERGVAYILLCAQNKPRVVKERIERWGVGWKCEIVGDSGGRAGWEKLVVVRIWKGIVDGDLILEGEDTHDEGNENRNQI